MRRLPLVHSVGAAFVNDALGIAEDDVLRREPDRFQKLDAGDAGGAGAIHDELRLADVAPGQRERVDHARRGDDRGTVLIVVENRDVEQLAQPLLDDEALGCLDVFEIDAPEGDPERLDRVDELVRIFRIDFEIEGVDVGEAFEQYRLALHHGLRRERAAIAETEDRRAVGDHGNEIALGGVVEGAARIFCDRKHGHGDARRISE